MDPKNLIMLIVWAAALGLVVLYGSRIASGVARRIPA